MAHFARSLRCGHPVRLQDYFRRTSEAAGMPHHDPEAALRTPAAGHMRGARVRCLV
jgi:hypothetical protein